MFFSVAKDTEFLTFVSDGHSMQTRILKFITGDTFLVAFISWVILIQLGFLLLLYFPLDQSPDVQTYLSLSQFDFEQNPVRRYRILIPLFAGFLDHICGNGLESLRPWSFSGDFSLYLCFLFVNAFFMSASTALLFKICMTLQFRKEAASIAVLAFLSCRWTIELTALPLVDSLYFFSIAASLYGLLNMQSGWLMAGILLGPWAKESYLFFVPLLFYIKGPGRVRTAMYLVLSGILVFSFRLVYDHYTGYDMLTNIRKDFSAFETIPQSLQRLMSFHGVYELFSVPGLWILIPIAAAVINFQKAAHAFRKHLHWMLLYLGIVMFQALLSADLGRMFFLAFPVFAIWIAAGAELLLPSRFNQD